MLSRLTAVARKEVLQLRRDRRSLALAFALPVLLVVLFGTAISWDVEDVETAVLDQDGSRRSRQLLDAFWSSGYFVRSARLEAPREIAPLLDRGDARLVLVVPPDFAEELDAGGTPELQAVVDGTDANTATIALGYVRAIVRSFGADVALEARAAGEAAPATGAGPPIGLDTRVWYNEELESKNMIVPGLVAVIMMIIAAMLTSLTIAREWERGTMEQLASTPVARIEVVLGKLLPYVAIGMIDVALITVTGIALFGVPFRGSVALLAVMSLAFIVGGLGLGMFISAVARSQLVATQVAMVATFLPAFLLSGFMYDIGVMPRFLQVVTYLIPARYFLVVTRGIFLKGVGPDVLRVQGLLMIAFAVVGLGLAAKVFHKRIA
jgi:ABC-2 type transport system permease protein